MESFLEWIYPFQAIFSNFGLSWQLSSLSGAKQAFFRLNLSISGNFQQLWVELAVKLSPQGPNRQKFQTGSIHSRQFPATLGSAGSKALPFPRSQTGKIFRLDLFISGNFWQLWFQLAENPMSCIGICLDWIYTFQAIFMNFGLSWQKNPQPRNQMESFLEWIYPFQAIFSNFGLSWQLSSLSGAKQAFFRLNLSISGNFQQLWVELAVKLSPQGPNRQKFQTGSIHSRQFPATLGSAGSKDLPFPRSQTGKIFRLDLFISGNFWQLCLQLAENPMSCIGIFTLNLYISGNLHELWHQLAEKSLTQEPNGDIFRLDLPISSHFQ